MLQKYMRTSQCHVIQVAASVRKGEDSYRVHINATASGNGQPPEISWCALLPAICGLCVSLGIYTCGGGLTRLRSQACRVWPPCLWVWLSACGLGSACARSRAYARVSCLGNTRFGLFCRSRLCASTCEGKICKHQLLQSWTV